MWSFNIYKGYNDILICFDIRGNFVMLDLVKNVF